MINVSAALCSDLSELVMVYRHGPATFINGIYVEGAETQSRAIASVQQPTAKELQNLPEGERSVDIRKFICNKRLYTTSDLDGTVADEVAYQGNRYKIIKAEDWSIYGHTTAFGARVKN